MRRSVASMALIRCETETQTLWLAQWNEASNSFSFVGGQKHDHESFRECLVREIADQLGFHEGKDVLVASAPLEHLEYTEVSRSTGEQTEYIIELFDVVLTGSSTRSTIDANPVNRWLSEPEIMAEACNEDRPIDPNLKRFLTKLGWDLFISYAHQDDQPDPWVSALVQAIRAEHAEFTPTPLRVYFNQHEIREIDDWQSRNLNGLLASKLMLAVMSEEYFRSPYCRKEWQFYRDDETYRQMPVESIVPVYIVTVPGLDDPATLRANGWQADLMQRLDMKRRSYLDFRQWRPHGIKSLGQDEIRQRLRSLNLELSERLARARRAGESRNTVPKIDDRDGLELESLPENDALELLNRHRALQGDEEWKAALRIARFLGCHALAIEVVAVYLWKHPEVTYCHFLSRLESEDIFAALEGSAADRAVQFSQHSQKLIGPLLEPTFTELSEAELRAIEYAALLSPDAVALPWLCELVAEDFEQVFAARPGNVNPWRDLEQRLIGLRLWTRSEGENIVRMHRIIQEVVYARMAPKILEQRRAQVRQYVLRRAESFAGSSSLSASSWEVEPLRDYALSSMSADDPSALHVGQWLSQPLHDLGRLEDAGILAHAAAACSLRLAATDPGNADRQRDLSVSQDNIGNLLSAQGDLTGALAAYRASLEISQHLAAADPGNADLQRDLSVSHNNIGNVLSAQGDLNAALVAYRASHKIFEQLAATDPGNVDWQCDLSMSQEKIGDVLSAKRDLTSALAAYRVSHEIFERLAAADPGNADWQRDLSVSREKIGDVLSAQGHLPSALSAYRASLESRQRLTATDWRNTGLQRDVSVSYDNIGNVLSAQGDLHSALAAFRASLEIRQRLAATDPRNPDWQRDVSVSHDNIGNVLRAQRDLTGALAADRASLEIRQRLAATDPGNAGWQRELSVSYNKVGDVLSAHGDLNAALAAYRASLEIRRQLAEADPANAGRQRDLSVSQEKIGDVLSAQRDMNAALATYRMCLEIRQRLAAIDPENAGWQRDLSVSQGKLGDVLSAQGDLNAALATYWASLEIRQQLTAMDPVNVGLQRDLSVSQGKIGDTLSAQEDLTAALVAYRASLEIRQRLAATDPGNAGAQRDLWVSFWRLATTTEQQDTDEAGIWWQKACEVLSAMKQRDMFVSPQDEQYLSQLRARLISRNGLDSVANR